MKFDHKLCGSSRINCPKTCNNRRYSSCKKWSDQTDDSFAPIVLPKTALTSRQHYESCSWHAHIIKFIEVKQSICSCALRMILNGSGTFRRCCSNCGL